MLAGNGLGLPRSQETRAAASNLPQQGGADSPVGILATIATDANRASQSSGSRGTTGVTTPGGQRKGYIPAAAFVNAYLGLCDNEQALARLEHAYQEQSMMGDLDSVERIWFLPG